MARVKAGGHSASTARRGAAPTARQRAMAEAALRVTAVHHGLPEPAAPAPLDDLVAGIRACRICRDVPDGVALPHEPRPIFQISPSARIAICSQAPGNKAHIAGLPFYDPSGVRLRSWMGLDEATFYDAARVAIVPMGFCFPGYDRTGGDQPPRRECRHRWHDTLFPAMPSVELFLCIGRHSLTYHLPWTRALALTEVVRDWRGIATRTAPRTVMALPHPSWRNNAWLAKNSWFEAELVPDLRSRIAELVSRLGAADGPASPPAAGDDDCIARTGCSDSA